jgi:hypothetical protein
MVSPTPKGGICGCCVVGLVFLVLCLVLVIFISSCMCYIEFFLMKRSFETRLKIGLP